jgi:hypothetical protein
MDARSLTFLRQFVLELYTNFSYHLFKCLYVFCHSESACGLISIMETRTKILFSDTIALTVTMLLSLPLNPIYEYFVYTVRTWVSNF